MCFTTAHWRLKRRCRVLPAHKQVCTICRGPPQWWKLLSQFLMALKLACTCFTGHLGGENGDIGWFPYINRLATASQDLHSGENCFLHLFCMALKQACTCLTAPPRRWKRRHRMFPAYKQVCTSFTGIPQWRKQLSPSFLELIKACTCFTAPPPRLKRLFRMFPAHKQVGTSFTAPPRRRCRVLPTHKQACSSFTGLPQWRRLLSPSFLALRKACTCFTAPLRRLKRRCRVFPANKQLHRTCTEERTASSMFTGT